MPPEVVHHLGVHRETLHAWWQRAQVAEDGPIVPPARVLTLEEENRRLRQENARRMPGECQENARLTEERDILKKATAFFAKESP